MYSLLSFIKDGSRSDANAIEAAGRRWLRTIASCGAAGIRGFSKDRLTPYVHLVGTHAGNLVRQVGGLRKFSGEKLEALNDSVKQGHLRQTNGRDLHASIRIQKRREIALRVEAIPRHERASQKTPKATCQVNKQGRHATNSCESSTCALRACVCV